MDQDLTSAVVTVRLFGRLRELAGASSVGVPMDDGDSVRDVIARMLVDQPRLADAISAADAGGTYAVAVDRSYADPDRPIGAARELALIPPVSGG